MSHIQYTILRSGTYYFNRRVPKHAVKFYGKFLRVALSKDPDEAEAYTRLLDRKAVPTSAKQMTFGAGGTTTSKIFTTVSTQTGTYNTLARSDLAVTEGVSKVTHAQESLEKISESVVGVSERIDEISNAIAEQVNGIGEINSAVSQIDTNTQKQAASFEEVTAASSLLSSEAEALKRSTAHFKTGTEAVAQINAPRAATKAPPEMKKAAVPVSGNLAHDLNGWDEF